MSDNHNDSISGELSRRQSYLNSFNFVSFPNDSTIVIDQKFSITRIMNGDTVRFVLANLNEYWKTDLRFDFTFARAELEAIEDQDEYGVRYLHFSLINGDAVSGRISIKIGYENGSHATSEKIAEFFGCTEVFQKLEQE
ncbi:hypothetical protein [Succinimonas amylolytica]|uniref:hypothetical protein n=1 Tax=Succinimonas amylolytica TaxID=83769 RepID=UPI000367BAFF|nr:hypothetical protein [Succinimonas amylolytica]